MFLFIFPPIDLYVSHFPLPTLQAIRTGYVHPNLNVDNPDVLVVRYAYTECPHYVVMMMMFTFVG